jgi:parallel beta-helix repeat protein
MDIDGGFGMGIVLANSSGDTISNSLISGNGAGVDLTNTQNVTINNNNISGNSTGGVVNNSLTSASVAMAKNNWWNNATGPQNSVSNSGGGGDGVSGGVVFSPWCAEVNCGTFDWLTLNASDLPNIFTIAESYNNGWILRADDVSPPADYVTSFVKAMQNLKLRYRPAAATRWF